MTKHVFIVAYGRSGTTLLMAVLNAIEGYCIRGENGGALSTLVASSNFIALARANSDDTADDGPRSPWFGLSQVRLDAYRGALAEAFREQVLAPPPGTRVVGFKEIRYSPVELADQTLFDATIDFLVNQFDDARIIFNTRNVDQVAQSGWWPRHFHAREMARIVATTDHRFRTAAAKLGPGRAFQIDYADYDGKPEGFRPLLDWLGEDLPDETLREISDQRLIHGHQPRRGLPVRLRDWAAIICSAVAGGCFAGTKVVT